MRHRKAGRKLGRNASHRRALMRNLTRALFLHGRIITTLPKAKEVRPFAEKLITLAKKGTIHARRLAVSRLGDDEVVAKLFKEIGPRFADRPGGYTRIIKRLERRLGDGGKTAYIELLKEGETKPVKERRPAAPAPVRVTEPAPAPTPAPPPEPAAEAPVREAPPSETSAGETPPSEAPAPEASEQAPPTESPEGQGEEPKPES